MAESSSIKKDTIFIGVTNFALIFIALVSSIILARVLGPSKQGLIALVLAIADLLGRFISLGTQASALYFINSKKYQSQKVINNVFSTTLTLSVILGLGCVIFYRPSFVDGNIWGISAPIAIAIFIAAFLVINFVRANLIGLYYALEKFKYANYFNLLNDGSIAAVILVLWASKSLSVDAILIAYLACSFLGLVAIVTMFRIQNMKLSFEIDTTLLKKMLKYGLPIYYNSITQSLQQRLSIFLIARYFGLASVGYFTVAYGVADRIGEVSKPLVITHFPKVTQYNADSKVKAVSFTADLFGKLFVASGIVAIPYAIATYYLLPLFYSDAYRSSITPAIIMTLAMIFWGQSRLLNNMFAAAYKQLHNSYMLTLGLIINAAFFWIFTRADLGIIGAALAFTLSYCVTLLIQLYYLKTIMKTDMTLFRPSLIKTLDSIKRTFSK